VKNISKKGLGRGIEALFSENRQVEDKIDNRVNSVQIVPIELLEANPYQPRSKFDENALKDLTKSIKNKGILQPILVRKSPSKKNIWQIIAGERRWRAAQKAGLHEIPIIIKNIKDSEIGVVALIENLQREDLAPIEEAESFKKLIDDFGLTQEKLSKSIGYSRTHITNTLRLLTLPKEIKMMLNDKQLNMGQVRAIIGQDNILELAKTIVNKKLNVRQVESLARSKRLKRTGRSILKDPNISFLEKELEDILGLKINIIDKKGKGKITFNYKSLDQLDEIINKLKDN
jgi:ParB family chromosome partitioning protein